MFIQTEATPNPATLKFIPGRIVLDGGPMEFANGELRAFAARRKTVLSSRRHQRVLWLRLRHRNQGRRRLATSQAGDPRRHHGALHVRRAAARRRQRGQRRGADEEDEFFNEADAETVATIKDLIETRVRPAVANDGGDITFRGFKDGIVYLNMKGSCAGCPSSTATLQHGIQNLLRHFVPDVVEVRPM